MIREEDIYRIGKLGKPHGIDGELSFYFEDDIFDRTEADFLFVEIDGVPVPFFIEEYRFRSNETALLKLEGIDTQERARELTGCPVFFPRPETAGESLSYCEVIGFRVIDAATGREAGTLVSIDDNTLNTLFEIRTPDGREVLAPAADELIEGVDTAQHTIRLRIPDGILEL